VSEKISIIEILIAADVPVSLYYKVRVLPDQKKSNFATRYFVLIY
jgi:hypothetical protein